MIEKTQEVFISTSISVKQKYYAKKRTYSSNSKNLSLSLVYNPLTQTGHLQPTKEKMLFKLLCLEHQFEL